MFDEAQRALQQRYDTSRIADRIREKFLTEVIAPDDKAFIERSDMFFLATVDQQGHPNCSYKGGDPGFVKVVDERTVAFPNYDGNGMYLSMGNITSTGEVGMLFIDFTTGNRLRLNGTASVDFSDPLLPDYPEAQFVVRVTAREVFPNCPRYIHRYEKSERSRFVPRVGQTTPVPDWKKDDWAQGYLPAGDPAGNPPN
jgi:predicted pyridoxine 5'-phosphate oxidase superfamily flavin-nucleotide-binding protein